MSEIHNLSRDELMKRVFWYKKKFGPYIEKKGLHNWKNLFRKPTLYEWVILIMVVMALFMAWAYSYDVGECKKIVKEFNTYLNPNYSYGNWIDTGSIDEVIIEEVKQNDLVE